MKNLIIILTAIFCLQLPGAVGQTKKTVKKTSAKSAVKKKVDTSPKKVAVSPARTTVASQPVQKPAEKAAIVYAEAPENQTTKKLSAVSRSYRATLGVKFIYGIVGLVLTWCWFGVGLVLPYLQPTRALAKTVPHSNQYIGIHNLKYSNISTCAIDERGISAGLVQDSCDKGTPYPNNPPIILLSSPYYPIARYEKNPFLAYPKIITTSMHHIRLSCDFQMYYL